MPSSRPLDLLAAVGGEAEGGGLGLHEGELPGELLRAPAVVGVEEGDEAAAGGVNGAVARRGGTLGMPGRRAGEGADAGVAGGPGGGDHRRRVGSAVVGDEYLPRGEGLGGNRSDGSRKRGGGVPGRGDCGAREGHLRGSRRGMQLRQHRRLPTSQRSEEAPDAPRWGRDKGGRHLVD